MSISASKSCFIHENGGDKVGLIRSVRLNPLFIYNWLNLWLFQEKDAEQNIISRVPELKQLSSDIDKATTAVINAKLSLESSIRQTQREEGVLGAAVNTISNKVDSINEHIDQVMEDAPTKLKVTVNVSDDDWEKMQKLHNQWMEQEKQMLADQYKQQEVLWQKQRVTDLQTL